MLRNLYVLQKRKGFIKMALRTGAEIIAALDIEIMVCGQEDADASSDVAFLAL